MSQGPEKSALSLLVLRQLAHPLKLRLLLTTTAIVVWQALFFGPVGEQVAATTSQADRERKRATTAREIERLKRSLSPHAKLVSPTDDVHDLMRRVIARIRSSSLRLVDLRPERPAEVGPFALIGLQFHLEGTFAEIDDLLAWVETEKLAMGVDALRLTPVPNQPGQLTAQITLKALAEKSAGTPKAKEEPKKNKK